MPAPQPAASPDSAAPPAALDLSQIAIPVQFHLGSVPVSLDVLSALQPGYVFELPAESAAPVSLTINGAVLGRGELVRIDDRLGVRLLEVIDHASQPA